MSRFKIKRRSDLKLEQKPPLLIEEDVEFISNYTGLPKDKAASLAETPDDLCLILQSLLDSDYKFEGYVVSYRMWFYLLVLIYSEELDYPLREKRYIADCLYNYWFWAPEDELEAQETFAQQTLCCLALCPESLPKTKGYKLYAYAKDAQEAFREVGKGDISDHFPYWILVLQKVATELKL